MNPERFDDRAEWLSLASSIINEGLSLEIFDNFSKISKNYNDKNNQKNYKDIEKNINKNRKIKANIKGILKN